ncbi:crossover junction endonuclease EME1 [Trichogramma pretiosum]|uniref:crossover junction endonuclease EME1 n=1 Tax=Trichogramma pretiosum TaxID=7493 RepID=UPI0006C9E346|nr:crossover junction endonuclease EME1 [Trichogramma pretiosum]
MNNVIEISDDSIDGDDLSNKCFTQKSVTNALDAICIDSNSDDNETSLVRGELSRRFSLSDFPEVDFGHEVERSEDARGGVDVYRGTQNTESYSNSPFKNDIKSNDKNSIELSSEDDYESEVVKAPVTYPKITSNLSSDESDDSEPKYEKERGKKKQPKSKKVNQEKKRKQEEKQQERQRKQEEAARQKALKQLNSKNKLSADPEHCLKLMEINYDHEIMSSDFFIDFLQTIAESKIKHSVQSQIIPNSITWKRTEEQNYLNDSNEICTKSITIDECQTIIVWNCKEAVKQVYENNFLNTIKKIKCLLPKKKITLVIYKIEDYFKYSKNLKDAAMHEQILGTDKQKKRKVDKNNYSDYPKISRKKFEEILVEVQVIYGVNTRIIESQSDIALLIYQYTKSIALLPSKKEKRQESSSVDWYVNSDNRDTVKVDKDGNGLKRLWQQQLGQFSLVSLETSESIASIYKSPCQLMEAYNNCTPAEGEGLLKDIPIRRAAGPLTSIRKVGPELSRKVYAMFTSKDGEAFLHE